MVNFQNLYIKEESVFDSILLYFPVFNTRVKWETQAPLIYVFLIQELGIYCTKTPLIHDSFTQC